MDVSGTKKQANESSPLLLGFHQIHPPARAIKVKRCRSRLQRSSHGLGKGIIIKRSFDVLTAVGPISVHTSLSRHQQLQLNRLCAPPIHILIKLGISG